MKSDLPTISRGLMQSYHIVQNDRSYEIDVSRRWRTFILAFCRRWRQYIKLGSTMCKRRPRPGSNTQVCSRWHFWSFYSLAQQAIYYCSQLHLCGWHLSVRVGIPRNSVPLWLPKVSELLPCSRSYNRSREAQTQIRMEIMSERERKRQPRLLSFAPSDTFRRQMEKLRGPNTH